MRRSLSLLAVTAAVALAGAAPANASRVEYPNLSVQDAGKLGKAPVPQAKWELSEYDA